MAQTTILAAGTTQATSTDVLVAAGGAVTLGLFVASGPFNISGQVATVMIDSPGADVGVKVLTTDCPTTVVCGPGTFRVVRSPCSQAIGVFSET